MSATNTSIHFENLRSRGPAGNGPLLHSASHLTDSSTPQTPTVTPDHLRTIGETAYRPEAVDVGSPAVDRTVVGAPALTKTVTAPAAAPMTPRRRGARRVRLCHRRPGPWPGAGSEDLHIRSVLLVTLADGAAAVAVAGGVIARNHRFYWVDPALAAILAAVIGVAAIRLLADGITEFRARPITRLRQGASNLRCQIEQRMT